MKLLRIPVNMIVSFDEEGKGRPIKFRFLDEATGYQVIRIDRVIKRDLDKFAGNQMIKYTCQSNIEGQERIFEIRQELETNRWFLYKI